jgi:hypothetical protein
VRRARIRVDYLDYIDVFAEREKVDFELDGAAWHSRSRQREDDIRRTQPWRRRASSWCGSVIAG